MMSAALAVRLEEASVGACLWVTVLCVEGAGSGPWG
jgi:uncharacterized MnhB-related membrane protein